MMPRNGEPGMDVNEQTEMELEARIVTMLFALACLADRASRAPHAVRAFVLWLLRRAETAVRECIAGQVWPMAVRLGNDPADALDLAASFRALARAVGKLAAQCRQLGRRHHDDAGEADDVERHAVGRRHRIAAACRRLLPDNLAAWPCPDTS